MIKICILTIYVIYNRYSSIMIILYNNLNELLDEIEWSIEQIKTFLTRRKSKYYNIFIYLINYINNK